MFTENLIVEIFSSILLCLFFISNGCVPIIIRDLFIIITEQFEWNVIDENQINTKNNERFKETVTNENILQKCRHNKDNKLQDKRSHDKPNSEIDVCNYKSNLEDIPSKHLIIHNPTDDESTHYYNNISKQCSLKPYMLSLILIIHLLEISTVLIMGVSVMMNQTMIMIIPLSVGAVFTVVTAPVPLFGIGMAVTGLLRKAEHIDLRRVDSIFFNLYLSYLFTVCKPIFYVLSNFLQ